MPKASPQRCNVLSTHKQHLEIALRAANAADAVSLPGFANREFTVSRKADNSEVTEIDRNTETAITSILRETFPQFGIYGEEHGTSGPSDAEFVWVIDPIDGTTNFVRGVPVWGSLIALVHNNFPVLGVVSAPALGMRWWATAGEGAYFNGTRMHVSKVNALSEAHVSTTPNKGWEKVGGLPVLQQLQVDSLRSRGFGDFWQHMLVAQGAIDVAIDSIGLAPYDNAAIYPIVQEAGGMISDRFGNADWRANSMVSSNGILHSTVMERLPS
ncbi:MAG: histidinol-phosphate phosphatase [Actinomycetota bacterium]